MIVYDSSEPNLYLYVAVVGFTYVHSQQRCNEMLLEYLQLWQNVCCSAGNDRERPCTGLAELLVAALATTQRLPTGALGYLGSAWTERKRPCHDSGGYNEVLVKK